jgi:hypothetical protein
MKTQLIGLCVLLPFCACTAAAQEPPEPKEIDKKTADAIAQVQSKLAEFIETKGLTEEIPLAKFLAVIEAKLSKDRKITVRLDEKAYGKELKEILATPVQLPPVPQRMTVGTALRLAMSQTAIDDVDIVVLPSGVLFTTARLGASSKAYDARDVVEQLPHLVPTMDQHQRETLRGVDPRDGTALLVRLLASIGLEDWESIQIRNAHRLIVYASARHHGEVFDLLAAIRRQADVAVIMHARLYEVDPAFFKKHIAPLFAQEAPGGILPPVIPDRRTVMPIDRALLKAILKQKLVQEGDPVKLRPGQKSVFLARQTPFRFDSGTPPEKWDRVIGSGFAGVLFDVRPTVTPSRTHLKLVVSQSATRLIGITKTKRLDALTGEEVGVEAPTVDRVTTTGTVNVADTDPILMPVHYRPPGKEHANKVWLLVVRPEIWIQEEQDQIKAGDLKPAFKGSIWDAPTSKESDPPPPPPLELTEDTKEILQTVLTHALTHPELKSTRAVYGTPKDQKLALADFGALGWPKGFTPQTHGYQLVKTPVDTLEHPRRVLGISLERFDLKAKEPADELLGTDAPIQITIFNAGGAANGGVIGGCHVGYTARQMGKRWVVEMVSAFDP